MSLFGDAGDDLPEPRLMPVNDWLPAERLAEEFKAIGFYLSGHPLDDYMVALKRKGVMTMDEVMAKAQSGPTLAKMAGVVAGRQERNPAKGNRFAFVQLSIQRALMRLRYFPKPWKNLAIIWKPVPRLSSLPKPRWRQISLNFWGVQSRQQI